MKDFEETFMKWVFMITAAISIIAVLLICIFLFAEGIPAMNEIGFKEFLGGKKWRPNSGLYGILPMIVGSIYVTAGAILLGVPIGIFTAVFMTKYCPKPVYKILKPAIELLAGIPSVVYGFFGIVTIVPFVRDYIGGGGDSVIAASIILGIMILPTIISVTESSLKAVPDQYYEGALALGATRERSVFGTMLPAAKSGILAGVVLGIGRAIGETMAVIMVAGNWTSIPTALTDGVRTMTANIVIEMGYAEGLHKGALVATGVVLFVFILIINLSFSAIKNKDNKISKRGKGGKK